MINRLFVVIYFLLHIPLLISVWYLLDSEIWESREVVTYQARCTNNELVVLQGSFDNQPYTFTDQYADDPLNKYAHEESLRFYCQYFDEVSGHISAYQSARGNQQDSVKANTEFWNFKRDASITSVKNYDLEVVKTELYGDHPIVTILFILFGAFFYYLLLQIVRITYQYIVFGSFVWHPYKPIKKQ